MNPLTCDQAREQLDLHAAGASPPAVAVDLDRHLRDCPACQVEFDRAADLMAQLDWHYREPAALDRLLTKINQPPRRHIQWQPWARRTAALAASVFILALLNLIRPTASPEPTATVAVLLEPTLPDRSKLEVPAPGAMERVQHARADRQPRANAERGEPSAVDVELTLANTEKRTMYLHPEDRRTALRVEYEDAEERDWIRPAPAPRRTQLAPGEATTLRVRLAVAASDPQAVTIHYHVPVSYNPNDPGEPRIFSSRELSLRAPRR